MTGVEAFAPAKINLTLHVTGQRDDGYHLLDSLVMFADVGDILKIKAATAFKLAVSGPMADGVPVDENNVVTRAAALMDVKANIRLIKNLPNAAGLGGGSSDAAATLSGLSQLSGKSVPRDVLSLGADVPVCLTGAAARMRGIGDVIEAAPSLPALHAVLVNPKLPVLTNEVFKRLRHRQNAPMPDDLPVAPDAATLIAWLKHMRNDLEAPAIEAEPVIAQVFQTLQVTPGCRLTRMSGSGGTCFGIYDDAETAGSAAGRLQVAFPGWWVADTRLNAPN